MKAIDSAARIGDGEGARALLSADPRPATVRAVACRADELRFEDPKAALEVANAALEAQARLPQALRRPRLVALTWWVFGSCCRAQAEFDKAEFAFNRATSLLPRSDVRGRTEVARRFAILRADQRRGNETRDLMSGVIAYWRRVGGRRLGERLCAFGGMLLRLNSFREAVATLEESLVLLEPNGDRFHISAIGNLAACRVELCSTADDFERAEGLLAKLDSLVKPGSSAESRCRWLEGNLSRRRGRLDESLTLLQATRDGIERWADGFDQALLLLDLTDLHLERGDAESARTEALSSFSVMTTLRNEPLALRAIQRLHRAAQTLSLDRATVRAVRRDVFAARS